MSADDKGILRLWKHGHEELCVSVFLAYGSCFSVIDVFLLQWNPSATVQAHKGGISCMAVNDKYVVTGASDGSAKIWAIQAEAGMNSQHKPG